MICRRIHTISCAKISHSLRSQSRISVLSPQLAASAVNSSARKTTDIPDRCWRKRVFGQALYIYSLLTCLCRIGWHWALCAANSACPGNCATVPRRKNDLPFQAMLMAIRTFAPRPSSVVMNAEPLVKVTLPVSEVIARIAAGTGH